MKTTLAALIIPAVLGVSQISSPAQPYTYVFIPQNDPGKPNFDRELAAATIMLNNDIGFFNNIMLNFTPYPGVYLDPVVISVEGNVTPASLTVTAGAIFAGSKTYFANDEQVLTDAEHDGKWVISTAVPDASATLPLLLLSLIAFPVWWNLSRQ